MKRLIGTGVLLLPLMLVAPAFAQHEQAPESAARTPAASAQGTTPQLGGQLPDTGQVQVGWLDPGQFSEVHASPSTFGAENARVRQLAQYMQDGIAKRLPAGARMVVLIRDLDRAGDPRGLSRVQVVERDAPSPTIRLHFARSDAQGRVVSQGDRTLNDHAVMDQPTLRTDTDPLLYEKRLVDRWLDDELGRAQ